MRKIILTESQVLKVLKEYEIGREDNDKEIVNDFKSEVVWFDYMPDELKKEFENAPPIFSFEHAMLYTIKFYNSKYDLKKIFVKDKDKVVGFLIYSNTNKDKEGINNDEVNNDEEYPILLCTAVDPNYRQRGLLKMMIDKAPISKPFLVHTSNISTPGVWKKLGCKVIEDLSARYGEGNAIELCGGNNRNSVDEPEREKEAVNEQQSQIYTIRDLADLASNSFVGDSSMSPFFIEQLSNAYKQSGDEGVIYKFKEMTALDLEPISHGKYAFVY